MCILEVHAESSGRGLLILLRVGWREEEGFAEKLRFELAMEVRQHFGERRAGNHHYGHHLLSPCYAPCPVLRAREVLFTWSSQ